MSTPVYATSSPLGCCGTHRNLYSACFFDFPEVGLVCLRSPVRVYFLGRLLLVRLSELAPVYVGYHQLFKLQLTAKSYLSSVLQGYQVRLFLIHVMFHRSHRLLI